MSAIPPSRGSRAFWTGLMVLVATLVLVAGATVPSLYRTYVADYAEVTFEIRVEFEVHGNTYSGNALWNGQLSVGKIPTSSARVPYVRGEAVALEGGPDRLVMLRRAEDKWSDRSYGLFPLLCAPPKTQYGIFEWLRSEFEGPCDVQDDRFFVPPELVRFLDYSDPASIERVPYVIASPGQPCAQICLRLIRVTKSFKPLTTRIVNTLPWLQNEEEDRDVIATLSENPRSDLKQHKYKLMDFLP